jgi:hypothetical protein
MAIIMSAKTLDKACLAPFPGMVRAMPAEIILIAIHQPSPYQLISNVFDTRGSF